MKYLPLLILFFFTHTTINAQKLRSCSQCSTQKYKPSDIKQHKLFELELLRNEIFARHGYKFKNYRLEEYFSNFEWYKYDYKNPIKKVHLNTIEKHNVALFKEKEKKIRKNRELLIGELKRLKKAVNTNNDTYIKSVFNPTITKKEGPYYNGIVNALSTVLNSFSIDDMSWHKGKAKYSIKIDNGYSISSKGIYIDGNSILITISDPQEHSSLMKQDDAFEYPSDYFSESESSIGGEFEFKNGKLILITPIFAG